MLGLGRIGQRVVEGLVARHIPCVAVERDEDAPGVHAALRLRVLVVLTDATRPGVHAALRLRVPVVLTDATRPGVLDALFLDRARCVMAATNDDAANLEAALNVRALRPALGGRCGRVTAVGRRWNPPPQEAVRVTSRSLLSARPQGSAR